MPTSLLPDPLHPAVVHFPIVLILLGAVTAVLAAVWRRQHLALWTATLLTLGAAGCWMAMETGEADEDRTLTKIPLSKALLEEHEEWAERTILGTAAAAALAIAAIALARLPKASRTAAILAAIASASAAFAVVQTGHRGGELVYGTQSDSSPPAESHEHRLQSD